MEINDSVFKVFNFLSSQTQARELEVSLTGSLGTLALVTDSFSPCGLVADQPVHGEPDSEHYTVRVAGDDGRDDELCLLPRR